MERSSPFPMMEVSEALSVVLEHSKAFVLTQEEVSLAVALGRVLAADVRAPCDLPAFRASMKDGYALSLATEGAEDEREYHVVGTILAGQSAEGLEPTIRPDGVYKIMTGAPVPASCNAVVMVEDTRLLESSDDKGEIKVLIRGLKQLQEGADVRQVGSDLQQDQVVMRQGETVGPAELGLLSSCGITIVRVYPIPRVGVLSTGDEVIDPSPGVSLQSGQIFDANRPLLRGLLQGFESTVQIVDLGIAKDDADSLRECLSQSLSQVDILITSGGVSMGEVDLVKQWLITFGTIHVGRVMMKPGKPLMFATITHQGKQKLIFATPGNPVSSYVTTILFVLPSIRVLCGRLEAEHPRVQVRLTHSIRLDPQRPEYHRATVWWDRHSNGLLAQSTGAQASSRLLSMRSANALLELPRSSDTLQPGATVEALLFSSLPGSEFIPPAPLVRQHHRQCC